MIYPWYNRDFAPKTLVRGSFCTKPGFSTTRDLPVITNVLKHGFEPPNCAHIFHTSLWHGCAEKSDHEDQAVPSKEPNISAHYFNIPHGSIASYNLQWKGKIRFTRKFLGFGRAGYIITLDPLAILGGTCQTMVFHFGIALCFTIWKVWRCLRYVRGMYMNAP